MTTLTLWHGTTLSAARRIFHDGIHHADPATMVWDEAAAEFDVDAVLVRRLLDGWGRFSAVHDDQDATAWLSTNRDTAACWAQRAPQPRWDALWAVWCIANDTPDARSPWSDPNASAWHVNQFFPDQPAVVEVRVTATDVRIDQLPAGCRYGLGASVGAATVPVVRMDLPVSGDLVVAREVVERRISLPAAAGMTDRTVEQLLEMVDSGRIVPLRDPGSPVGEPYWTIDDIFDLFDDT